MPLPRPFGDPFSRPNVKEDERAPKRKREVAPISSSAFSFNLGTASTNTGTSTSTPKKVDVKSEHVDRRLQSTPIRFETPLREVSVSRSSMTPGAGPSKPGGRPLQSLPSPFGGMSFKTPDTKMKLENATRLGEMSLFGAGLRSGDENGKGKRKASDYDTKMQEHATGMGRGMESPAPGMGRMRALGQLEQVDLGESMYLEDLQKRVEEEGIGVSPRGKKIIKYSGKG